MVSEQKRMVELTSRFSLAVKRSTKVFNSSWGGWRRFFHVFFFFFAFFVTLRRGFQGKRQQGFCAVSCPERGIKVGKGIYFCSTVPLEDIQPFSASFDFRGREGREGG